MDCDHIGKERQPKFDGGRCPILCECRLIVGFWERGSVEGTYKLTEYGPGGPYITQTWSTRIVVGDGPWQ